MTQKTAGAQVTNYLYDIQDRLVRVEDDGGSAIADYYYDPFGRRLWKEVGGTRTYYFYSDEGLIGEYDSNGNEIKTYGYAPDSTWGTNPLFQKIGSDYYWYVNDHLGTPQMIIDTTGKVVWASTYDSFGNAQIITEDIANNLRFPGQYFDVETGLHYNWHRYYDPGAGRYLRTDPIGFAGGDLNLYGYVFNSPVNWVDPWGLEIEVGESLKPILDIVKNTEKGKHMYEMLHERSSKKYRIFAASTISKPGYKSTIRTISINPKVRLKIHAESECGDIKEIYSSLARQLAHEMGHAVKHELGIPDDDHMSIVSDYENPVAEELDELKRTDTWTTIDRQ